MMNVIPDDHEVRLAAPDRAAGPGPRPDDNEIGVPARERISSPPALVPPDGDTRAPLLPPLETPPRPAIFAAPGGAPGAGGPERFQPARGMAPEENSGSRGTSTGLAPVSVSLIDGDSQSIHATPRRAESPSEISGCKSEISNACHAANVIARALGVSAKTIHRRAAAEGWPRQERGNRRAYAPPAAIAALLPDPAAPAPAPGPDTRTSFTALAMNDEARAKVLARERAVLHHLALVSDGRPIERALVLTVVHFAAALPDAFLFSTWSLRRWVALYAQFGLNGLVEQKQGRSGRPGAAQFLPPALKAELQADTIQHGSSARASRNLMRNPELPAKVRCVLHEGHASKSYVPPSILAASKTSPLTAALLQGPKTARLEGHFTPGHYDDVKAGAYFVGDDMTSNVLVWREDPGRMGFIIGQPQILPVLDIGSLRWLNVRVIMRQGGQYSGDDVWGLYGDVFDTFGLPAEGIVSEFGHWQSNRVLGYKTGLSYEDRVGGLASLGVKLIKSYDPRTKIIETRFNQLQHVMDACPGVAGRDQRTELSETVKRHLQECKSGKRHPSEVFLHVSKFADHVQGCMAEMNHERQDGMVLRGESPLEKWANDNGSNTVRPIADSAKWLYRSAMNPVKITRNGVRVHQGSGAKMMPYYYDNPELLTPRQGQKVHVFWNDHNPDAAAIILGPDGTDPKKRVFLGVAKRVQQLGRFSGTPEQLDAELARKKAAMLYARTELRAIDEHLHVRRPAVPADASAVQIGQAIAASAERVETKQREVAQMKREIAAAEVTMDDARAALGHDRAAAEKDFTPEEISALLGGSANESAQ